MQFDKGFISPYFITDSGSSEGRSRRRCSLLYEKKISNLRELVPLLEKVARLGKPLLIVAEDVDSEAADGPRRQQAPRRPRTSCAVKALGFGDRRKAMLGDIGGPDRRHADLRRPRDQAGERSRSTPASARPRSIEVDEGQLHDHRRAGKEDEIQKRSARSVPQIDRHRLANTIARSSRNASPS